MITLFEPNETNFTHNGLGNLDKNIIDPVVEEDLNGLFSLSFRYPLFALHGLEIDGQSIVRAPIPDGPDQLFRVYKPVKSMGYLEVFCYHIFYDLVDNFIEDTNIVGKNGQEALTQLGSRTQYAHNFRFFSDITTIAGSRVVRKNPVSFLLDDNLDNSFVNRWGGELKRDNFDVFMYNAIGSDKGVTIRHKKDLLGYEAVVDWTTVVTRIMPIGFDGLLLPEKYVDSPVINSYVKPKIQIIEYSDVKAAVGQYADDKDAIPVEQAYKELRKLAKLEYEKGKIDYPEASYKVEFATLSETEEYKDYKELETVRLGDTVTVNHNEDNLNIKAKVIHYRFNPLTKKYIDIELGNYRETFSDLQGKIDSIYNRVEEVKQDLSLTIQISANGKNTIYRGVATPVNARVGDLWFKPIENGYEELYLYVGDPIEPWLLILSTADLDRIKKEVEKAQATADQAKQDAINAYDDAVLEADRLVKEQAVKFTDDLNAQKTQLETEITVSRDQAIAKAQTEIDALEVAQSERMDGIKAEADAIKQTADKTKADIDLAISNAGFTTLNDTFANMRKLANDARLEALKKVDTTAYTAKMQAIAGDLSKKADTLFVNQELANKVAQATYDKKVGELSTAVSGNATAIKKTETELTSKATKAEVDPLKTRLTTAESTISQTAAQVAIKANQSDLDTVSGRLTTAEAELTVQAGKIASKVEQSVFNAANTRLSTAESTITQHANLINSKVSQTEFSKVDGRLKTAETSITQEAGKIETLLTRVSGAETSINSIQSTVDSNKLTITNHTGKISTIEQNVNGLQTTVAGKANQSQVTQLADYYNITIGKVASWTNSYVVSTSKHMRLTDINGKDLKKSLSYEVVLGVEVTGTQTNFIASLLTNGSVWTLDVISEGGRNYNHPYIYLDEEGFPTIATYHDKNYEVTATVVQMASRQKTSISVLSDNINLKVSKGDVSSQINIEANRTLISSGKLILDANTYIMGTTFANDVKAKSLEAVNANIGDLRAKLLTADVITSNHLKVDSALITKLKVNNLLANNLISDTIITDAMKANALTAITANITSIRSQVLVSNVVEATHLKADAAMINKLFATTALIDTLTSKVAFINSVKAIDISADRITAGTLNAANVNIINLNVSKIAGLNSTFVQSAWNSLNSTVSLDGEGLRTYSDNLETRIKSGSVSFYVDGDRIGSMLPLRNVKNSTKKSIGLVGETGRNVIIGRFATNGVFPSIEVDGTTGNIGVKEPLDFHVNGTVYGKIYGHSTEGLIISSDGSEIKFFQGGKSLMYGVEGGLRLYRTLNMNGNNIDRVDNMTADTVITSLIRTNNLLTIKRGNETYVQMVAGGFRMQSIINMNTFNIENVGKLTYSSDARYKSNIKNRVVSDLDIIRNIRYVNYIFNSTGAKQRGLIAQELNAVDPSLVTTSSDGYLSYDSQQYVHTIGHALQELDVNVRKLRGNALANNNILLKKIGELEHRSSMQNVTITRIDTFVTQHELEIKNLKKRIKELEEKVT